jgi:Na+/proline symporter
MCYFATPSLPTQLFQRIAMAQDVKQIKQSFTYAAFVGLAIELCIIWTAILLLADKPGLAPDQLVPYMVQTYTYTGLKGLLGVGVIALAMSTADSSLNSCAVVIANDILPRIAPKYQGSLFTARGATLGLGFLALVLALRVQGLLKTILLFASFSAPIVVIPILLTVFGFQTSRRVVLMAIGAGFVTVVSCLLYFKSVNSFFPGMLANLVVMLGAHYLLGEKGGWGHNPKRTLSLHS